MDCEPLNDLAKFYNNRTILPPELKTLYRSEHWATQQHQHVSLINGYHISLHKLHTHTDMHTHTHTQSIIGVLNGKLHNCKQMIRLYFSRSVGNAFVVVS